MIAHFIAGWIKKIWYDFIGCNYIKNESTFPESFRSFRRNIKVKVDLSNYVTKSDIKNI